MPRLEVAGVRFDPLDENGAVDHLIGAFREGRGGRAVFVNVDVAQKLSRRPELDAVVSAADLVLADGMPLVWASRLAGTPLPERVAGSTVLQVVLERSVAEQIPVMLVGGRPGSASAAVGALGERHPGIRAGWYTPPFGFESDPAALSALHDALESFGRCICFVGLGFPKQERLMESLAERHPDWWFVATGGGIDFLAEGNRAPLWMQRAGLEWLYRFGREPRRLARRYLVDDLPFAARMLVTSAGQGRRGRS